ncbi:MAG: hypothetical protein FWE61_04055 [Micrococcales bacterium]|nr:hypothetical protein [Micrococcales bacterium]
MLTSARLWTGLATEHGIVVDCPSGAAGADLVLRGPSLPSTTYQVKTSRRPVHPSTIRRVADGVPAGTRLLLVTDRLTQDQVDAAETHGVSIVASCEDGGVEGVLVDAGGQAHHLSRPPAATRASPRPGRVPWGTYAVAFALLEAPAGDQHALAARSGVSRVRVSQVLGQLGDLVVRDADGWRPADRAALAAWLVERYPTTPRLATTWTVLDPPVHAATTISGHLGELGVRHAVSGDVAADTWAPWARPATAWVWAANLADLSAVGATPATPETATVTLAVSADPNLLAAIAAQPSLPLLSPWRVWVDLVHQNNTPAATVLMNRLLR